VYIK
jgi:hypothetical protein